MDSLEEWNQWVRDYLFNTDSKDKTKTDVLVQQVIDAYETDNDGIDKMDYNGLYDLELEELIRILEREYNNMISRSTFKDRRK